MDGTVGGMVATVRTVGQPTTSPTSGGAYIILLTSLIVSDRILQCGLQCGWFPKWPDLVGIVVGDTEVDVTK
jgi:hypothetical protein